MENILILQQFESKGLKKFSATTKSSKQVPKGL